MSACNTLALAVLVATVAGSRLKPGAVLQHDFSSKAPIIWNKGDTYICTQKWEKSFGGRFQNKFCLANFKEVLGGAESIQGARASGKATPKIRVSTDYTKCVAQSRTYRFKVCNLKGKEDVRLNYKEKKYVPKSCFEKLSQDFDLSGTKIPLFASAVNIDACRKMFDLPPASQNKFIRQTAAVQKKPELKKPANVPKNEGFDWDNLDEAMADEDETTTTTTSESDEDVDEMTAEDQDSFNPDEIADTVIAKILAEDAENVVDGNGVLDNGLENDLDADSIEDEQEDVSVEDDIVDTGGSMNLDEMNIAEIRKLWRDRDAKERQNKDK